MPNLRPQGQRYNGACVSIFIDKPFLTLRTPHGSCGVIRLTYVMASSDPKTKHAALRQTGTFNPRAARVRQALFQGSEFFDASDLLQVKYETLRALEHDGYSIAQAAREFGLSRPTIYQARREFGAAGLRGLLPAKRGPKGAHKLTPEIREFIDAERGAEPGLRPKELAARVRRRFEVPLHPRTIEKALQAGAKRGRRPQP